MVTPNISSYTKGYLSKKEIDQKIYARQIKFQDRKYNQIRYVYTF